MNILVSGGAKNGKSMFAQKEAKRMAENQDLPLYYIATMIPCDEEDLVRIDRHQREREGWGFQTLECGRNIMGLLGERTTAKGDGRRADSVFCGGERIRPGETRKPAGVFLLDSVTALLSNEMFRPDGRIDRDAPERVAEECVAFAEATKNTLFVSDYIYGDPIEYDQLTEAYRKGLALIDRALARVCHRVVEVTAGIARDVK